MFNIDWPESFGLAMMEAPHPRWVLAAEDDHLLMQDDIFSFEVRPRLESRAYYEQELDQDANIAPPGSTALERRHADKVFGRDTVSIHCFNSTIRPCHCSHSGSDRIFGRDRPHSALALLNSADARAR
jgi:hypothetical protein